MISYYSFQSFNSDQMHGGTPKGYEKVNKFLDFCGSICIVSMENNWVYSLKSYRKDKTAILPKVFAKLRLKE